MRAEAKPDRSVKEFWRIWKYVWPQWPRLVVVVATAVMIGMLFSVSFVTIIPLLKVMMGEEGLQGWLDRKSCEIRYGMDFYVPDRADLMRQDSQIAYFLLVSAVEEDGLAWRAGIRPRDRIVDVNASRETSGRESVPASKLLELLATAGDGVTLDLAMLRSTSQGALEPMALELTTRKHPDAIGADEMSLGARLRWGVEWALVNR
ncbi:MAG TPA: PDZ domain-containing protein, partial [Phycisphaerales bacterium]|nr:PDZ domain-containing protein [Phycisphaerales bacterium]